MNLASELNSELAMAISRKFQNATEPDRRAALAMLRQIHATLRPLSLGGERAHEVKTSAKNFAAEDRSAAGNH